MKSAKCKFLADFYFLQNANCKLENAKCKFKNAKCKLKNENFNPMQLHYFTTLKCEKQRNFYTLIR